MQLLGNRCLILPNPPVEKISGIYLPDQSKEDRNTGVVVLIGNTVDKKYDKRQVLFNKISKTEMVYEGLDCVMVYVHDIIAILD